MSKLGELRHKQWAAWLPGAVVLLAVFLFPLFRDPLDAQMSDATLALAYVVMALGLNIVVGFAGLLDLGYVAFYAFGALTAGWLASDHFTSAGGDSGIDFGVSDFAASLPGIHLNFLLIVIGAIIVCAIAGAIIGLPTLRLRGDYIAIVTLAFGEIISRFAQNGDEIKIGDYAFSNGRESISPIDQLNFPLVGEFDSATNLRPYFWAVFALVLVVLFVALQQQAADARREGTRGDALERQRRQRAGARDVGDEGLERRGVERQLADRGGEHRAQRDVVRQRGLPPALRRDAWQVARRMVVSGDRARVDQAIEHRLERFGAHQRLVDARRRYDQQVPRIRCTEIRAQFGITLQQLAR